MREELRGLRAEGSVPRALGEGRGVRMGEEGRVLCLLLHSLFPPPASPLAWSWETEFASPGWGHSMPSWSRAYVPFALTGGLSQRHGHLVIGHKGWEMPRLQESLQSLGGTASGQLCGWADGVCSGREVQGGVSFPKLYLLLILHLKIIELSLFFLLRKHVNIPCKTVKTTEVEKSGGKKQPRL